MFENRRQDQIYRELQAIRRQSEIQTHLMQDAENRRKFAEMMKQEEKRKWEEYCNKKRELAEYYKENGEFPPHPKDEKPEESESKGFFYNLRKKSLLNLKDPQKACQMRLSEHPRYFDCGNCTNVYKCEDGKRELELRRLEQAVLDDIQWEEEQKRWKVS